MRTASSVRTFTDRRTRRMVPALGAVAESRGTSHLLPSSGGPPHFFHHFFDFNPRDRGEPLQSAEGPWRRGRSYRHGLRERKIPPGEPRRQTHREVLDATSQSQIGSATGSARGSVVERVPTRFGASDHESSEVNNEPGRTRLERSGKESPAGVECVRRLLRAASTCNGVTVNRVWPRIGFDHLPTVTGRSANSSLTGA